MSPSLRRSPLVEFIKSTLAGGLLGVLPIGLAAMLIMKLVATIAAVIAPIADHLPARLRFRIVIAAMLLIIGCLVAGLLARDARGAACRGFIETVFLILIPRSDKVRTLLRSIMGIETNDTFKQSLVETEEALVPALAVEAPADGRCTVFVPAAPTPGVGANYIVATERVHLLDTSMLKTARCISHWGAGSEKLL